MSIPADATEMAELISRLGLIDEFAIKEILFDYDQKKGPPQPFVQLLERRGLITPYQGKKLLKGETDGYFMGGYRLLYRIAAGTFGRVYRGDDPRTGQTVAVKVLRRKWMEDPRRVSLFEREGRIGLSLTHPNIVQILAVSKDPSTGSYFIVMEFIEGGNLRDILTIRKKLDIGQSLRIMAECVEGLAYAHSKGLTHRDIKPSNILLATNGTAKLVDFGLAEINQTQNMVMDMRSKTGAAPEEQNDRTLDYAGLEKATNVPAGDVRTDIYFLGHSLFEMITGEPLMPRTRERRIALERRRYEEVEGVLNKIAEREKMDPILKGLIGKAVALEPFRRFQTPEQFLEQINNVRRAMGFLEDEEDDDYGEEEVIEEANQEAEAEREPTFPEGKPTLVAVERNAKLQEAFRDRLTKLGLRVLVTSDPYQAVDYYRKKPFHVLIVDVGTVPVGTTESTWKILNAARDNNHLIAAVLLFNAGDELLTIDFADEPMVATLVRPLGIKQLSDTVEEMLPWLRDTSENPVPAE